MTLMTRAAAMGGAISRFAHLDLGFTPLGRSARRAGAKKEEEETDPPENETAEEKAAREKSEAEAKKKAEDEEAARKAKRTKKAKKAKAKSEGKGDEEDDEDEEDEPDDADEAEMERCEASGFGAGIDAAMAYGARLENSRCRKIFASEAAAGRTVMACELAFGKESRGLSADAVIAILSATPVKSRLASRMENVIPAMGGGDSRAPATTEQKIAASWDHAIADLMPPK